MDVCFGGYCYCFISDEEIVYVNNCNGSFNWCNLGNFFLRDEFWRGDWNSL